jgi:hypothetical protein
MGTQSPLEVVPAGANAGMVGEGRFCYVERSHQASQKLKPEL